jgi:hypothetical protein
MELDYLVVDVFTDTTLASNSLASDLFHSVQTNRRGSPMRAGRAAPLLWQMDGFSCRDAHAFNRLS